MKSSRGITKRWFTSVALIVILILVVVSAVLLFSMRKYYYDVARMALDSYTADELTATFGLYGDSSSNGFETASRDFLQRYPEKDTMAVWIIDGNGNIILTSSGFQIKGDVEMPDYYEAMEGDSGSAKWTGRLPSGEKIMASTCVYNYPDGTNGGAVRFMVSLTGIDKQLVTIGFVVLFSAIMLFGLVVFSGSLFVSSIVNPVKDIGETAKRIAGGDLEARISDYKYNDEIGELCTNINDMAEKLEASDRMKNDFISTISHELRTPLTAIKGWGETLLQVGDSDKAMTERGMNVIISEASRLSDMVEELLDFSRISSGRMKLNIEKIDILAELDEVVFSFKERAIKEGIELIYNAPMDPAPAAGDASRIKQVFINILDNAIKYNKSGGKIFVSAEIRKNVDIKITVRDTGQGIAPEDLPHVKEKFYKANTAVRGSGIGLAVCDEIIKLHCGKLELSGVVGEGTTVEITIPIARTSDKTEGETNKNEQQKEE